MLVDPTCEARPFEVMKITVGRTKQVLVLSPLLGLKIHFIQSSRICAGNICPACAVGLAGKFQGYLCVLYEGNRWLLRLTSKTGMVGTDAGLFVPGTVLQVSKPREKRPLVIECETTLKTFDREAILSRVELLSVVARLHGLPGIVPGMSFEEGVESVSSCAVECMRLALAAAKR